MFLVYLFLVLLLSLLLVALYAIHQLNAALAQQKSFYDEGNQHLSHQFFQSFDSMKKALFELESKTQQSLTTSLDKSAKHSSQLIIEQQNRNHHVIGELSGRLTHLTKWQKDIQELNHRIETLGKILDNTNLKGKFGELQLEVLLKNILPSSWVHPQYHLPNGARADFMIDTHKEHLSLCIDSKFPVQSYKLLAENPDNHQYLKEFLQVIKKNIQDIAEKYIIPTVTVDFAFLFVPSESIYSQILLLDDLMSFAQKKKVLICSPQTLHWQLIFMKKVLVDYRIDGFIESKAHLIHEMADENEKVLNKINLIERKTLHIQRDIKFIESVVHKQVRFIDNLLNIEASEHDQTQLDEIDGGGS